MPGMSNEVDRIDWIKKTLGKIPPGGRILDAGAGEQQFREFCTHLNYVAQDFGEYDGLGDGGGLQMGSWNVEDLNIRSDITSIPEPDGSFDAVMCIEVLEHLPEPVAALREFSRLLKRNGHLILTAPFCSLTHFSPYHFFTGFNRFFYKTHLEDAGFEIIEMKRNGNFFEFLAQEIRRVPKVAGQYTDETLRLSERIAIKLVLRMLNRFSVNDSGSNELLCYGYHVLAKKR